MDSHRAAEFAARHSYGRLLAYLVGRSRDVAAAEDALGEAFLAALRTWPRHGVPHNPDAWLLVTARRRLLDGLRRSQTQTRLFQSLDLNSLTPPLDPEQECMTFPDERLKLLFVCAHPAIDRQIRTPLMLQTVLGLTAAQIASAFLVAPTTMGQRLARAKAKIRDAGIPFAIPAAPELPQRLGAVLEAIYGAYSHSWDDISGGDPRQNSLAQEALWLARLSVQLLPEAPEAKGLLALILYCESRRTARRTAQGEYVPLLSQDTALWCSAMIAEAEQALHQAAKGPLLLGRFQLEAAIQSVHAQRRWSGSTDWQALAQLYEGLVQLAPTVGAMVGRAGAIAQTQAPGQSRRQDPKRGLAELERLPSQAVKNYQPYWALKAHLHQQLGQQAEAQQAYGQAMGLTEDPAVRAFLLRAAQQPLPSMGQDQALY